jgi:tetrapyrrole methylase family protein / MazG family protein
VSHGFDEFVDLIAVLRGPGGCPWDREQTHASIAKNLVEEAYEAVHAIETNDVAEIREELGDVLLQVILQSQIAADAGEFTIDDVVASIHSKIVRRHPHVFGDVAAADAAAVTRTWDEIKSVERAEKRQGLLDTVPHALPALMLAQTISRKAVSAGFEWDSLEGVWAKVHEEIDELKAEEPGSPEAADEIGDLLFTIVNLARKQGIDAETALRGTCDKFRGRWSAMEKAAAEGGTKLDELGLEAQEALWQKAKLKEKGHQQ